MGNVLKFELRAPKGQSGVQDAIDMTLAAKPDEVVIFSHTPDGQLHIYTSGFEDRLRLVGAVADTLTRLTQWGLDE